MKRTCKTFAKLKVLKHFIQDKEYSAFDDAPKRFWNRLTTPFFNDLTALHGKGVFSLHIVWELVSDGNGPLFAYYGIFSNKELMLKSLLMHNIKGGKFDILEERSIIQICDTQGRCITFTIRGANEEIKSMI